MILRCSAAPMIGSRQSIACTCTIIPASPLGRIVGHIVIDASGTTAAAQALPGLLHRILFTLAHDSRMARAFLR